MTVTRFKVNIFDRVKDNQSKKNGKVSLNYVNTLYISQNEFKTRFSDAVKMGWTHGYFFDNSKGCFIMNNKRRYEFFPEALKLSDPHN